MLHRLSTKLVAPVFAILLTLGLVFGANSFRNHSSSIKTAAPAAATPAHITLSSGTWSLTFSELSSITSKIIPAPPTTDHTKALGEPQPPTVVLKRDLDPASNQTLSAWHQAARAGLPSALINLTLTIDETGGTVTYTLENAWLSKLTVTNLAAGAKQPAVETATIVCDALEVHTS